MKLYRRFWDWVAHLIWAGDQYSPCPCELCQEHPDSPVRVYRLHQGDVVPTDESHFQIEFDETVPASQALWMLDHPGRSYRQTPEKYRERDYPK